MDFRELGWIPHEKRSHSVRIAHDNNVAEMPKFAITGASRVKTGRRVVLWDASKKVNGGKHFPTLRQLIGSCFPAGTLVRMADGSEKPIESIRVGDEVITHTGRTRKVVDTMSRDYSGDMLTIAYGQDRKISLTSDHKVAVVKSLRWSPDEIAWLESSSLSTERFLAGEDGSLVAIREVTHNAVEDVTVYDFEVEEDHSFIAHGIVVHNCVGMGGCNAGWYLGAADKVIRRDPERVIMPFEPYQYGRGRFHAGIRGSGSGSTGSGQAKAARVDGTLSSEHEGLSGWSINGNTITWSAEIDTQWSDGSRIPESWISKARPHLVRTTAKVTSYEEVRDALLNYYPVTVASNQGFQMRPRVSGGKHWGIPSGTWMHQMCFIGVDDDSSRPGCYCLNSWGEDAHGAPADDAPPGGFWVDAETVTRMARQDDTFAWSQFDGFPEQDLNWEDVDDAWSGK